MSAKRAPKFDPKSVLDAVVDSFITRHGDEIITAAIMGNGAAMMTTYEMGEFVCRLLDEDTLRK